MSSEIKSDEAKGFLRELVNGQIVINCGRLADANFTGLNLEVFRSEDNKDLFIGSNSSHPGSIYPYAFTGDRSYIAFAITPFINSPPQTSRFRLPRYGVIAGDEIKGKEQSYFFGPNLTLARDLFGNLDIPEIQEAFLQSIKNTYRHIDRAQTPMSKRERKRNVLNAWYGVWAVLDDFSHVEEQRGRERLGIVDRIHQVLDQIRQQ